LPINALAVQEIGAGTRSMPIYNIHGRAHLWQWVEPVDFGAPIRSAWDEELTAAFPEAALPFEKDMHGGFNEDVDTGIVCVSCFAMHLL